MKKQIQGYDGLYSVDETGTIYAPDESTIDYESDTEIGKLIDGKNLNEFLSFIDEFFSQLLKTYNPDLYNYAIRKLKE